MNAISPLPPPQSMPPTQVPSPLTNPAAAGDGSLRETFDQFVGEVFFGQMLQAMRKTVGKPAYFHGGRGEEIFSEQLDQVLSEKMTAASARDFTGPMYELFRLGRPS